MLSLSSKQGTKTEGDVVKGGAKNKKGSRKEIKALMKGELGIAKLTFPTSTGKACTRTSN